MEAFNDYLNEYLHLHNKTIFDYRSKGAIFLAKKGKLWVNYVYCPVIRAALAGGLEISELAPAGSE